MSFSFGSSRRLRIINNRCDFYPLSVPDVARLGPGPVRGAEWRVGCEGDSSLAAEVQEFGLAEVWVALHLVGHGLHAAPGQDVIDLFGVEIREA